MKRIRLFCFGVLACMLIVMGSAPHKVSAAAFKIGDWEYQRMVSDSLVSTGNNARLKKALQKAREGKEVTIAYLGGSITEGVGASPNEKCYAELSWKKFS